MIVVAIFAVVVLGVIIYLDRASLKRRAIEAEQALLSNISNISVLEKLIVGKLQTKLTLVVQDARTEAEKLEDASKRAALDILGKITEEINKL